jgi:Flp pilus assembly pilin Flp
MRILKTFLATEDGATPLELGLFSALISVAVFTAIGSMDDGIAPVFRVSDQAMKAVVAEAES